METGLTMKGSGRKAGGADRCSSDRSGRGRDTIGAEEGGLVIPKDRELRSRVGGGGGGRDKGPEERGSS